MSDSALSTRYSALVMRRCEALGRVSEEEGRLTRRFATPAMAQVNKVVGEWMAEAGMEVRRDALGNLIGRYEAAEGGGSTLALGSHLDTVRDAGKYDGPLGVMVALVCVQRLHDEGRRLPFAIEVVAFADEEGLRYGTAYLGSKAYAGSFDPHYLDLTDPDGMSLAQAITEFGGDPAGVLSSGSRPERLMGYCEVHIEQGPVLESMDLPVAVVAAIAGQTRFRVTFTGEAGHAGTVPMRMRRDALCAAADFIGTMEALAGDTKGLVATVGQLSLEPGASNVIPGKVTVSLDVRHRDDDKREWACKLLQDMIAEICDDRRVAVHWEMLQTNPSVPCSTDLSDKLAEAVDAVGYPVYRLTSGAGHDAVIMSRVCPVAMLFVRCKEGISHNPAESVEREDVAAALDVMSRFLDSLAAGAA